MDLSQSALSWHSQALLHVFSVVSLTYEFKEAERNEPEILFLLVVDTTGINTQLALCQLMGKLLSGKKHPVEEPRVSALRCMKK